MKRTILILLLAALAGCSNAPEGPPNIILVTVDTLRWDYLSTYGFQDAQHTPTVNRLAKNGFVFENAVATAGTTVPAHGSIMTGLYPRMHGARSNFHGKYPQIGTIADSMAEAGYQTAAFVSSAFIIKTGLLGAGFQTNNLPFRDPVRGVRPQLGSKTIRQASEWVNTQTGENPLFMWLHLWEPHGPYDPTDWSREKMKDYEGFLKDGMTIDIARTRVADIVNNPENLQALRQLYAGEVRLADQYLGQFIDLLDDKGLLDNTVVIFTADHGQALGEGKRMGHGAVHLETVIRIPLIVADFRNNRKGRISTRVGALDIAPTIADLANLTKPFDYSGRSLTEPGDLADDWPYLVEVEQRSSKSKRWEEIKESKHYDRDALGVYTGDMKLTYRHGNYTLWETATNLKQARKLDMADEPFMTDYLKGLMEAFNETEIDLSQDELSDEDLKILQGLGYVQ